ncbi:carbohydrate porin [Andreprevotia chitinilytica]|uniref:carbohydrate porin n=1 Tax=Andreprevotia chitinilytica TaxID=396808 RepID=UPI0009FE1C36|nr:carbohydrate porin [Andreprevotia chitinilytica]
MAFASTWMWANPAVAAEAATSAAPEVKQLADSDVNPADLPEADQSIKAKPLDQWTGLWNRQTMLGDIGGLRSWLWRSGVTVGLTETSEVFGNLSGGMERSHAYNGLTTVTVGLDTQRAFGWQGGNFNASVLHIHGQNLSSSSLGTIQTASGIEADPGARLWELWYQQKFLDDKLDVKIGQQSIDQEFMVSQYAGTFINTMFGWPAVPSFDMPSGGPAYPLSGIGVRVRARPTDSLTVLGGIFDGNPAGDSTNADPQLANAHGTTFSTHKGKLFIGELQYAVNQPAAGEIETGGKRGLPGNYKLGFWYNNLRFADQRYDDGGLSLADPASSGNAAQHHGNYSVYAVADQMIWRPSEDSSRTLNVFTRIMGAPGDRNVISFSANAGVTLTAPFEGRDSDTAGLGMGYARVGSHAREFDADQGLPMRSGETYLEATYQYQVAPWWQLQADVQYTLNPGAGILNPKDTTQKINNIWLVGLRTNITF